MNRASLQADLERLGFFSYVDPENIAIVREGLLDNIINEQAFFFPHGDQYKNINGRLFSFDAEALAEGGALDLFNEIRYSIEKAGLVITKADQIFTTSANSRKPTYYFMLNNRACNLGNIPAILLLLWGLVTRKYARFLNRSFRKAKIKERIYFMNDACSDTQLALLTPVQAKFINDLKLDPRDKVYRFSYWSIIKPVFQIIGIIFRALFKKKIQNP